MSSLQKIRPEPLMDSFCEAAHSMGMIVNAQSESSYCGLRLHLDNTESRLSFWDLDETASNAIFEISTLVGRFPL